MAAADLADCLAETAETTEAAEAGEIAEKLTEATIDAAGSTFAGKYTAQGQRLVTDASFRLGEGLQAMLPEDAKAPVTDLLNALKIETVAQSTEGKNQGALRLILNDVNAFAANQPQFDDITLVVLTIQS